MAKAAGQTSPAGVAAAGILTYAPHCASYVEYDPIAVAVAARVGALIERAAAGTHAEHIGSTAVPGCAGKGIVDLMVLYPRGALEPTRAAIDALGFQRQSEGHVFPESRPMRVGAIVHDGLRYRLHAHIIADGDPEGDLLRGFRDALIANPALRDAYQARKRAILLSGLRAPADYTEAKTEFITAVIAGRTPG